MSTERRISFPEEPLRRVSQEPKPATVNQDSNEFRFTQEKDGQLFIWDNVMQFPDGWSVPNKQIPLFSNIKIPLLDDETRDNPAPKDAYKEDGQMCFWIPGDYIQRNKEHWRNAKRGIGSRPFELPRTESMFHNAMQRTFREYGLNGTIKPIFTFAVASDNPKTASSAYAHKERFLVEVAKEDRQDFLIGMIRINEYATNYAAREFLIQNLNLPGLREAAKVYAGLSNLSTYGILLRGTFTRMRELEIMANHNNMDYKHALLTALFQHDSTELNAIIALGSEYTGYSNINELAIEIGRKRYKKPDFGKWFDKLDASRSDGKIKTKIKNGVLSTAALGVFRNPGIIEIHGAIIPASPIIAGVGTFALVESLVLAEYNINALMHPEHIMLILEQISSEIPKPAAAIAGVALLVAPFVIAHEAIHHYSADEHHMGLTPTEVIKKEVTPYKSRFETEEE